MTVNETPKKIMFHGGCYGCTRQEIDGIDHCRFCQYFLPDWTLPDLNNSLPTTAELERRRICKKYGIPKNDL
jgi:hypothetical protein